MSQIISASRRTDLPALHPRWLINRLRAGFAMVKNPMNTRKVARVSLLPEEVGALVLWTRFPRPLLPWLDEIEGRVGAPLWLVTLNGYPRALEARTPAPVRVIEDLHVLAARSGSDKLHWRYDPIVLSSITPVSFHEETFGQLARALSGVVEACHISFVDRHYRKTARRFAALEGGGVRLHDPDQAARRDLAARLWQLGRASNIEVLSCCEPDLSPRPGTTAELFDPAPAPGPRASGCVDLQWVRRVTGVAQLQASARPTRPHCLCCASKDIGAYDTCSMGCVYCYATRSDQAGRAGRRAANPDSVALGPL